ncbi:MAG: HD domain-containing protein [Clostridia bacterium]|nr:HD domain-containing protein [Clostridia bacterium]
MNFTQLDDGRVDGFAIVKSVDKKTSSKGDTYLDFTLGDNSGEINAKLWRYVPQEHGEYEVNNIVKIRGTVSTYNGADQLRIERIRTACADDGVLIDDLVKSAAYSSEEMYKEALNFINEFQDAELKALVFEIYSDYKEKLLYWPAAYKLHHAIRGGLLLHTLSIVKLCKNVCDIYPFVDKDLLIAGALLHDIAKIDEFDVAETGIANGYSLKGNLLGHLTMGAEKIDAYAKKLGTSEKTTTLLKHMILSHHGIPEYGACVKPMTIEAEILSELDLLDSRIYEMKDALLGVGEDGFSHPVWALDNRKLFNHQRTELSEDIKLF